MIDSISKTGTASTLPLLNYCCCCCVFLAGSWWWWWGIYSGQRSVEAEMKLIAADLMQLLLTTDQQSPPMLQFLTDIVVGWLCFCLFVCLLADCQLVVCVVGKLSLQGFFLWSIYSAFLQCGILCGTLWVFVGFYYCVSVQWVVTGVSSFFNASRSSCMLCLHISSLFSIDNVTASLCVLLYRISHSA